MGEEQRCEEVNSRYQRWVAMWTAGVRASGPPMALGEPSTARFIERSPAAALLLGDAVSYLDVVEPQDASAQLLRLMRDGLIEGARTRRRLRSADGSLVDVHAIGWVVRSPDGPDLGLGWWIPGPVALAEGTGGEDVLTPAFPKPNNWRPRGDRLLLDESWRIQDIQTSRELIVGWTPQELANSSMLERTHPDDVPGLLFALARATTDSSAKALVRVRHRDGAWRSVEIAPTVVSDHASALVGLVLVDEEEAVAPPAPSITAIPSELRRIADHIESAAVMAPLAEVTGSLGLAAAQELSPRQWEIVLRLVRGERVSTIAAEMCLSRSTIRNHLTGIFRKVGVHSQEELVSLYHRHRGDPASG